MSISLIFSKRKIFQSKHFTMFIKEFRMQKRRIKFIQNLYTTKSSISFIPVLCRCTLQGVVLHICCDLGLSRKKATETHYVAFYARPL